MKELSKKRRLEIQEKALQILKNKQSGILDIAPRVGKTKIGIDYLKIYNGKYIVIMPDSSIRNSWIAECKQWNFNLPEIYLFPSIKKIESKPDLIQVTG